MRLCKGGNSDCIAVRSSLKISSGDRLWIRRDEALTPYSSKTFSSPLKAIVKPVAKTLTGWGQQLIENKFVLGVILVVVALGLLLPPVKRLTEVNAALQRGIVAAHPDALQEMSFASGSMGPKVEAACRFVRETGRRSAIGRLRELRDVVEGRAGTQISNEIDGIVYAEPDND